MAITISWLVEGHVIYWNSAGIGETSDVKKAEQSFISMLDEASAPLVHTVYNFAELEQVSNLDIREDRPVLRHPKNGWNIFVAAENPLLKMKVAIKGGQANMRMRWFATMKEAGEFLQSVDTTLPDLGSIIEDLQGTE